MQRYCAYQDRCHHEVRQKLVKLGLYGDNLEEVLYDLVTEGFLNEERFARSFTRGKFRMKGWGRIRIEQELKKRQISEYCIRKGLEEIEATAYQKQLYATLQKKGDSLAGNPPFEQRSKAGQYAIRRGFEPDLVWAAARELFPEDG